MPPPLSGASVPGFGVSCEAQAPSVLAHSSAVYAQQQRQRGCHARWHAGTARQPRCKQRTRRWLPRPPAPSTRPAGRTAPCSTVLLVSCAGRDHERWSGACPLHARDSGLAGAHTLYPSSWEPSKVLRQEPMRGAAALHPFPRCRLQRRWPPEHRERCCVTAALDVGRPHSVCCSSTYRKGLAAVPLPRSTKRGFLSTQAASPHTQDGR